MAVKMNEKRTNITLTDRIKEKMTEQVRKNGGLENKQYHTDQLLVFLICRSIWIEVSA